MLLNKLNLDFTLKKYKELCEVISASEYNVLTLRDYFTSKISPPFLILRHDVDSEPEYALKMAKIESDFGIHSTYYFRTVAETFKPEIIREISEMGHEVGYHYEVLDKAKGDYGLAINIFKKELEMFREICSIETIAQHGSPLMGELKASSLKGVVKIFFNAIRGKSIITPWINLNIWKEYDFRSFGLLGEAYLSVDFKNISYLSDTGRSWDNSRYKIKDLPSKKNSSTNLKINKTDEIIELASERKSNIYLLIHPNQWKETFYEWLKWLAFQYIRNTGKIGLKIYWKLFQKTNEGIECIS